MSKFQKFFANFWCPLTTRLFCDLRMYRYYFCCRYFFWCRLVHTQRCFWGGSLLLENTHIPMTTKQFMKNHSASNTGYMRIKLNKKDNIFWTASNRNFMFQKSPLYTPYKKIQSLSVSCLHLKQSLQHIFEFLHVLESEPTVKPQHCELVYSKHFETKTGQKFSFSKMSKRRNTCNHVFFVN